MTARPVAVDLFCGAGGLSLGFEQAGFDAALGVDRDGYHVATHERNFPYGTSLCRSASDLTAEEIFDAIAAREVDAIVGGPPCQGFSHMGLRDARDERNNLVFEFARIVAGVRPKAFVMENVPGMLSGDTRPILDEAIRRFEAAGYAITRPIRVLDASDFGVPQKRRRLIVLGLRSDIGGTIDYPDGPASGSPPRPTVLEAIADLPNVDRDPELFERNDAAYEAAPKNAYARAMRATAIASGDYAHPRRWAGDRVSGCLRVRHSRESIALYKSTPVGTMVPGHKLPKLDPNGLAPTLRAGSDSTHGSYTAPRPIHPIHPRCITAREAARLHGYPDWFDFYPLKWHAYRQIGNSVCPPLAKAIGLKVMAAIACKPTRPRKVLALTDRFDLPADRPRTLKRIPQVTHFPPVIAHLFAERFDGRRLRSPRFSFADVERAVVVTGVQLTWIRRDTFLNEIARSRNVLKLLAPCLLHGYTIRRLDASDAIGEFVPTGDERGIEVKAPSRRGRVKPARGVR